MADEHSTAPSLGIILCAYTQEMPSSKLYDEIVTIVVGPLGSEKTFQLYRQLLCTKSRYFDKMLNGGFKEAGSNSLRLRDVHVTAFQIFYVWLNSGHIDCTSDRPDPNSAHVWMNVIDAYIFADYHHVPALQNALADYLFYFVEKVEHFNQHIIPKLYKNTTSTSPLRKLVVDMSAQICRQTHFESAGLDFFPKDYLFELICALKRFYIAPGQLKAHKEAYRADMESHFCERYHDHADDTKGEKDADMTSAPS